MNTYKLNRLNRNHFFKFSQITLMSVCTLFLMRAAQADCTSLAAGDQVVLNGDVTLHAGVRAIEFGTYYTLEFGGQGYKSGWIDFSTPGLPGDISTLMKEYVLRQGLAMTFTGDLDPNDEGRYRFVTNRQVSGFFVSNTSSRRVCREDFSRDRYTVIPAKPTPISGTNFDPSAVVNSVYNSHGTAAPQVSDEVTQRSSSWKLGNDGIEAAHSQQTELAI